MNSSPCRSLVNTRIVWALRAVAAMAFLICTAPQLKAAPATATWNANTESDIAGYKVSYGTQSGTYSTTVDVGNVTTWQVTLAGGQRYYFAVQAYNTSAQISVFSAEAFVDIPASPAPPVISSLSPTSGSVGTSITIAGSNFGTPQGMSLVRFNGTTATPSSWTAASIVVPVPNGATTGLVVVTVGGMASNGRTFTVTSSAPSVTSLSPISGAVGTSVTINGANFGTTQGMSIVRFNGTTATPSSWAAATIVVPVPSGATTGSVVVTVGALASNGMTFTVTSPGPNIVSLSPNSGTVGTSVIMAGTNFGATQGMSSVRFNGMLATPTSWTATRIVAPVPTGATTGMDVVMVNGVASNGMNFTVMSSAPSITSLSPASGVVGTSVTITGANFGTTQGMSSVRFNGTTATLTSWSATSLVAQVPTGATTGAVAVTVNGVASNGVSFTVSSTGNLPVPWTSQDIGNPALAGQATFASGTFTVSSAGLDLWSTSDQFRFVSQTLDGNGEIVARVGSLQNTDPWAKAAVMIREDLMGNAPSVVVEVTPTSGIYLQQRVTRGGASANISGFTGAAPQWIRLVRSGNTFTGYYSANGTAWTPMGTSTVSMASRVYVGLALTSHNASVSTTGVFSNVTVTGGSTPNQAPTLTQPVTQTSAEGTTASLQLVASDPDGNPLTYSATGLPASLSINPTTGLISGVLTFTSAGTFSVTATASDGTLSNSKTFSWSVTNTNQPPTLTQPVAQTSAEGTMVSLQLVASDPDGNPLTYSATGLPASLTVNPTTALISGTLTFTSAGTFSVTATASDGTLSNSKTFTWTVTDVSQSPSITSLSPNSGTVGTSVTIAGANFGTTQGMSSVRFNGTTATLTSWSATSLVAQVPTGATTGAVTVTVNSVASNGVSFTVSSPGNLPVPWTSQDIGNPALAGQATFASGTFTVSSAGLDLWNTSDQFRFVSQTLDGNGEIVARLGSQQNTDPWAKAAVMIREDLMGNAPNVVVEVTPTSGIYLQQRVTRGGASALISGFTGAAPRWIRLVRSGNTFSGYYSANGTAWTPMGTATVSMASRVYVGLALTSHNASVAANATFTNVSVNGVMTLVASSAPTVIKGAASPTAALLASSDQASTRRAIVSRSPVNALALSDYDGDGRTDIATYRPSTGEWRVLTSRANYATGIRARWGTATDVPVPGDYDGDRKTDIAYYRPSTGTWSILKSSTDYTSSFDVSLGAGADVPVPGDYDGDGITDVAVYSPATGQWRILRSSTNYVTEIVSLWGTATDIPVPGDYDGDGKTDLAVYSPSTGQWKILQSKTDYTASVTIVLGTSTDISVPADYDGDGVTDIAVFRPSTGTWQVRLASSNFKTIVVATLGTKTDVPVPGDYDGDGKADLAVFHGGKWQILYSKVGYTSGLSVIWGRDTDIPLPRRP